MKTTGAITFMLATTGGDSIPIDVDCQWYYQPGQRETMTQEGIDEKVELEAAVARINGICVDIFPLLSKDARKRIERAELDQIQHQRGAA